VIEASEVLPLFLEAAVAFLGFGALVSLFGKSTDSTAAALAAARLRCMLELNIALLVCAVLPFVLDPWIRSEVMLWRIMCLGPLSLSIWVGIVFSARTRPFRSATTMWVRRSLQSLGLMTFVLSLVGVLSGSGSRAMACFVGGLFLALLASGSFFALVTSVAFSLARGRKPSMGSSRMGEVPAG